MKKEINSQSNKKFNYLSLDFHGAEIQEYIINNLIQKALLEINKKFQNEKIQNLIYQYR